MTSQAFAAYLTDTYSAEGEHLFAKYPSFLVFRHNRNRKWFAVIMGIPRNNLGMSGEGESSVVNLKCDTKLIPVKKNVIYFPYDKEPPVEIITNTVKYYFQNKEEVGK